MISPYTYHPIRKHLWRYMFALVLVGVGLLLCLSIPEVLSSRPFLAFWPVVVLAAEFGGKGPGILATVASALCANFILYPYYGGLNLHEWIGMTALGIFLAGGLAISVFIGEKLKIQSLQRLQAVAVAANEARYRSLFEAANVGKSVTLPTGEIQVNRAFCDMLGYDPEDMLGKTWQELTPPEEIGSISQQLAPLLRGEKDAARFEKRYIHKSGAYVWTDVSVVVQRDGEGTPLHFISTVVDMTERKRAEATLAQERQFLTAVLDNIGEAVVACDVQGVLTRFNQAARDLHSLPEIPIPPEQWAEHYDLYQADGKTPLRKDDIPLFRALQGEPVCGVEIVVAPKRGEARVLLVNAQPMRDAVGRLLGAVTAMHDITDRKRSESNLIESERRYRALFENMPAGFVVFEVIQDEKGIPVDLVILAANQGFSATTGLTIQEVIGKRLTQVIPGIENDAANWIGTYGKVALTGEARQFEQGSERLGYYYSVTAYQSGWKKCAVTFLDITARKRVEAEARRERDFADGVLNSLPGVLYCYDESFRFLRWNKNFERVTGYTSEEVARQSPLDYFAGPGKDLVAARIQQVFEKGESSVEADFVSKDGTRTPYFFTGLATTIEDRRYLVGVGVDISAHKQAEAALRESEQRFASAFHTSPAAITITRVADGKFIDVNQAFLNLFEFNRDEVVGHTSIELDIISVAERSMLIRKQLETGGLRDAELLAHSKSGRPIHLLFSSAPMELAGEMHHVTTLIDITASKQAEAALRSSEQEFRSLAEAMPQIVWVTRPDGWNIYFNQQWVDYTGLTLEESYGHGWNKPFHPDDQQRAWDAWQRATQHNATYSLECRLRRADGAYRWWLIRGVPLRDTGGEILKWFGTCTDIEDIKQAEATLRESETRFRTLFEQAAVGVAEIETATGRFIRINQRYCDIAGYTREEIFALDIQTIIHPDDLQADLDNKRRLVAGEIREFTMDKRYFRKDGSIVWVSLTVSPMWSPGATPDHHIAIVEDISARKQAEQALQQLNLELEQRVEQRTQELTVANTQLQELDKLKSLFIASMSHELRTPLNSIIGFTGIILQGMSGEINPEQRKQLGIVKNNARHLLALINDIIDVSKIESGAIELADEAFDLSALIREVSQALANAAAGKNLTLSLQVPPELVIRSDRRRLKQILINLLDNAIKFTDVGGVAIELVLHESRIMLSVHDSGIGIDTQHQHRLFQAFSQIAPPSERVYQGTGLGLYLSQRLAHLLGGDITLTSATGIGSRFTLTLPDRRNPRP